MPFVNSITPVNNADEISWGILKIDKKLEIRLIIPDVFRIDIITENSTIKPPIERIFDIEDFIALPKISPKFENLIGIFFSLNFISLNEISSFSFFQNLKKYPTKKDDKICDIRSISPILLLLNIEIPTVAKINNGPELLV